MGKNERALSENLYDKLKKELSPVVEMVIKDKTLDMEFRGKCVIIYYRGSKLVTISEKADFDCNMQYCHKEVDNRIKNKPDMDYLIENMPFYKQKIDWYLATIYENAEKEAEQLIVKENNYSVISNSTDYYVLDTEYAYKNDDCDARPDLLALEWKSCQESRKNNVNLVMSFVELKFGDGAVKGSAGIKKHINDYLYFCHHPEVLKNIAEDMEKVFEQKVNLGLIPSFVKTHSKWERDCKIKIDYHHPEMVFIFANRDPESIKIYEEIKDSLENYSETEAVNMKRIFVMESSTAGYGLFKYNNDKETVRFKTLEEFYKMVLC